MAAITGTIIAAGAAAYQGISAANAKAEADNSATQAAYKISQIQEADKFKSLQVPTLGLQLAQQNLQARQAMDVQGLKDIGAAGVLGGLTAVNQQGMAEDLQLSAQAQEAQYKRDLQQAQNAQEIEANRVAREGVLAQSRLQGAQMASAQAQANQQAAIAGGAQIIGQFGLEAYKNKALFENPKQAIPGVKQIDPNALGTAPGIPAYQANLTGIQGQQMGDYNISNMARINANPALGTVQPYVNSVLAPQPYDYKQQYPFLFGGPKY